MPTQEESVGVVCALYIAGSFSLSDKGIVCNHCFFRIFVGESNGAILMEQKKILYIAQEITPYLDETPLGAFARFLPQIVQEGGDDVRVFMPKFGTINERRHQLHEVIRLSGINIIVNDTDCQLIIKVASVPQTRIQVYFIDNKEFFQRKSQFGIEEKYGNDTVERSVFFFRGVFEAIKKLRWIPDVVHCMGWFSALAPIYLQTLYKDDPDIGKAKVVYSPFDTEVTGEFSDKLFEVLAFDNLKDDLVAPLQGAFDPDALRRMAIAYSDGVVMPAEEVTEWHSLAYAQQLGKPILAYPGLLKENAGAYREFYNSLLQ